MKRIRFRIDLVPGTRAQTVLGRFGRAWLLADPNGAGECRLQGGDPRDRIAAREWVSLFCHEALVSTAPERPPRRLI